MFHFIGLESHLSTVGENTPLATLLLPVPVLLFMHVRSMEYACGLLQRRPFN